MAVTGNAKLAVTMSIVDKATEPLRKINASIKSAFAPLQGIANRAKLTAAGLGLPKLKEGFGNVKNAAGGVLKEIKGIGKELAVLGGLGAGFFGGMIYSTANAADEAYKAAQKVGVTTESWTKMAHAADMSGVSVTSLQSGMSRLNKGIIDAANGTGEAKKIFDYLGISIEDSEGKLKNADAMMLEVADRMAAMEDGALKSAVAIGIFGRSAGPDMIPMLNVGSKGLADAFDEAARLRKVITDEQGQAAESFNDSMSRMRKSVEGVFMSLGHQLIPVIEPVFKDVEKFFTDNGDQIASTVKAWIDGIRELVDVFGGWGRVIPVVVGGLAALKLAPLIMSVFSLGKAIVGLSATFLATPIGWIAVGVAGLAYGFMHLWRTSEGFRNFWIAMWAKVKSYVGGAIAEIKAAFDKGLVHGLIEIIAKFNPLSIISSAMRGVISYLTGLDLTFPELWNGIKKTTGAAWGWVRNTIGAAWDWIGKKGEDARAAIVATTSAAWDDVCSALDSAWAWIKTTAASVWENIKSTASSAWNGIASAIHTAWKSVLVLIQGVLDSIHAALSAAWDGIKTTAIAGWNAVVGGVKAVFTPIVAYFDERISAIKDAFQVGFLEGVKAIFLNFNPAVWIADALDALTNCLLGFKLTDAGKSIISSLWDGLKEMWASVTKWLEEIPGKIKAMIPESLLTLVDKVGGIAGGIKNAAGAGFDAVSGVVSGATGWLGDKASSLFGGIGGALGFSAPAPVGVPQLVPTMAYGPPVGVESMIRKETLQRSESVKEQRVLVDFSNVPEGVSVKPERGVQTKVERASPAYVGMRMGY